MPQGKRTRADKLAFRWMLQNVNLLYLGCSVLLLVDISYLSRFCAPPPPGPGLCPSSKRGKGVSAEWRLPPTCFARRDAV